MNFNLERLFCSSQAETNFIGFPTKNLFTSGKRCVAIAFYKSLARSNLFICPAPTPGTRPPKTIPHPPGTSR